MKLAELDAVQFGKHSLDNLPGLVDFSQFIALNEEKRPHPGSRFVR